jgi:hypothetical protein
MKTTDYNFLPLIPQRLINLWDMIQFPAHALSSMLTDLYWLKSYLPDNPQLDRTRWPIHVKNFIAHADLLEEIAKELELVETLGRCRRFKTIINDSNTELIGHPGEFHKSITTPEIVSEIEGLESSLQRELMDKRFIYIPNSKAKFCEQPALFGEPVNKAFPSAVKDIMEAGNCLAVDLNTATVFHLMRVVECGMRALAVHLKVKIKDRSIKQAGWDQLIKLMEKEIQLRREKYDKNKRRKRKDLETCKFYTVMVDELNIFKEIWRDHVMHTGSPYNEAEALGVLTRVHDFMQRLSTKVSETDN